MSPLASGGGDVARAVAAREGELLVLGVGLGLCGVGLLALGLGFLAGGRALLPLNY